MAEDYETTDDREFDGIDYGTLYIGRRINSGGIEFHTRDCGNSSAVVISPDHIWDVIDHLIELAGPRAFASPGPACSCPPSTAAGLVLTCAVHDAD